MARIKKETIDKSTKEELGDSIKDELESTQEQTTENINENNLEHELNEILENDGEVSVVEQEGVLLVEEPVSEQEGILLVEELVSEITEQIIEEKLLPAKETKKSKATPRKRGKKTVEELYDDSILTIQNNTELSTDKDKDDILWHEVQNTFRTKKILTGMLGGVERTENGSIIAVVYYKELRVIIPVNEMMIRLTTEGDYGETLQRQNKILGNMLGAQIDFIIKGIDGKSRTIVGSRTDAMMKKRNMFYMESDKNGRKRIFPERIVQARVIAVAEKIVRVEIFGVETSILARDLSWDWVGDAREEYNIGDEVLVRITEVKADNIDTITVKADIRSLLENNRKEKLSKCRVQGKYAGKVADIHKGVVFVKLSTGINAIAHSCFDSRTPSKKDDVSFVVTHIEEEKGMAIGIITRIIKQNI